MYKFNNDNIVTGYIKQLLHTFNLPMCDVWTPGMKVYQGRNYIYKNRLLKATRTGAFNDLTNFNVVISNYFYGDKVLNITKNLELRDMIYDSYTHNYLGDYLRFYGDYKEINLMSMYNCFNYDVVKNIDLSVANTTFKSNSNTHVVYAVPIKFNKKYTIAIECSANVEIISTFYNNGLLFKDEEDMKNILPRTYMKLARTSFQKPFVYKKLVDNSNMFDKSIYYNQEKNFKMLIKLPITCESSITVLEGDYTSNYNYTFDNNIKKLSLTTKINAKNNNGDLAYNRLNFDKFISNIQLTSVNTGISYPFSDRLIEYLFDNVITHNDVIMNNVRKVQDTLLKKYVKTRDLYFNKGKTYYTYDSNTKRYTPKTIENTEVGKPITSTIYEKVYNSVKSYGAWDDNIREALYKIILDKDLLSTTFDTIGYCDKDLEKTLGGLENE